MELLTTCMNSYFTRVIACIDEYDGDVIKFAGGWLVAGLHELNKPARCVFLGWHSVGRAPGCLEWG